MKVLVACEESQTVCKAFRELGHEAYSCDIMDCSGGHPEWHIKDDAIKVIYREHWDMIIAHPPCTHLANTGQWAFARGYKDPILKEEAIKFVLDIANAPCERIAIENPVGILSTQWQKPTQIIQPYYFGDEATKTTCLWLKGLPKLEPTNIVGKGEKFVYIDKKGHTHNYPKWMFDALKAKTAEERRRIRSKTFEGIARAMAEQWGKTTYSEDNDND